MKITGINIYKQDLPLTVREQRFDPVKNIPTTLNQFCNLGAGFTKGLRFSQVFGSVLTMSGY